MRNGTIKAVINGEDFNVFNFNALFQYMKIVRRLFLCVKKKQCRDRVRDEKEVE